MTCVDKLSLFEMIPHKLWIEKAPFLSDMKYWLGIIDPRNTLEMQGKSSFWEQLNRNCYSESQQYGNVWNI